MPVAAIDFALESRPPNLPPRNCFVRILHVAIISTLCTIGVYTLGARATGPVITQSTQFANGVRRVVEDAISHADEQAMHSRDESRDYTAGTQARRLSLQTREGELVGGDGGRESVHATAHGHGGKSSLLLRMAALRKQGRPVSRVDESAVRRYFPSWELGERAGHWNESAVLRDLVLAVSHLAQEASSEVEGVSVTPR